ncbi:hypothetical protein EG68_02252 [Paragonimus skrjabini miyazakii]|uniref:Uncharacterized protein n=1 Tax=Paragonimus skrjabini miyazakii TaxID=59628 RepID=A0A8S9Z478_9TREM|nr:hypothetical protein EG68_02252 [Paragonimus skrjabini miyazakii]
MLQKCSIIVHFLDKKTTLNECLFELIQCLHKYGEQREQFKLLHLETRLAVQKTTNTKKQPNSCFLTVESIEQYDIALCELLEAIECVDKVQVHLEEDAKNSEFCFKNLCSY